MVNPGVGAFSQLASEEDVLGAALDLIRDRLPRGWSVEADQQPLFGPDAFVSVTSPDGQSGRWAVLAKRTVLARDVLRALNQLRGDVDEWPPAENARRRAARGVVAPMVVARYLPASVRDELVARGASYADATGNMLLRLDRPGLYLRDVGASADPWRGPGRPRGTLRGEPAARVVRALADYQPPYTVPELAKLAGASTGGAYRVVEFLEEQALVEREARGPISSVRWLEMLTRWAQDYSYIETNDVRRYVSLRGLDAVTSKLAALSDQSPQPIRYVVTGSLAAQKYEPHAPTKMLMIYTDKPEDLARLLDVRPVETGADVLLARPAFDVVYDRSGTYDGGRPGQQVDIVAVSQLAVDLLTGPGRNPAEGQALLEWMQTHLPEWRDASPRQAKG